MKTNTEYSLDTLTLQYTDAGALEIQNAEQKFIAVTPIRCFPWKHPRAYISLQTSDKEELFLIDNLDSVPAESKLAIEKALRELDFSFVITKINSIILEFEIRRWSVETLQGHYEFQTKLEDWPQQINDDELLIRDISGNFLIVRDLTNLDEQSQKLLWPYLG